MEKVTVKALKAHTAVGSGWKIAGETYPVSRRYGLILEKLGKVSIVGESAHGHRSLATSKKEKAGSIETEGESGHVDATDDIAEAVRLLEEAKAQYTEIFGKEPHHRMKYSGIIDAIAAHVKE